MKKILNGNVLKYAIYTLAVLTIISLVSYCRTFYIYHKLILLYDKFPIFVIVTLFVILIFVYLLFLGNKCNNLNNSLEVINRKVDDQSKNVIDLISYVEESHHELIKSDKLLQHFILEVLDNIKRKV